MKKLVLILSLLLTLISLANAEEITFFDKKGDAIAYVTIDRELTIYLWDGEPVAYLVNKGNSKDPKVDFFTVYGFNGKQLGWIKDGILRDKDGNATGFVKGAVNLMTNMEPMKSMKSIKPMKSMKEMESMKPLFTDRWADISLKYFLKQGI